MVWLENSWLPPLTANVEASLFSLLAPVAVRQMFLDNARTMPLAFSAPSPEPSCAKLDGVKGPTLVVGGAQTLRIFSSTNGAIVWCIPGSRLAIVPKATHVVSHQNPAAFNDVLLTFLGKP